jgi:tRNA threonylcarbamoyl adenosine modification protein (Sua5/YciO/YrdC/YwlC family)
MRSIPWPIRREDQFDVLAALRQGALVVYPTETVYGIGVALSAGEEGIERLRAAKGSPAGRPFILLAATTEMAFSLWSEVPLAATMLAWSEWPGPLTLVGRARSGLPQGVLGEAEVPGLDVMNSVPTVSVRVPGDPALCQLITRLGEPILSTSANLVGQPAPLGHDDVDLQALDPDLVLVSGPCPGGLPSTVLTVVEDPPRVLRQGAWRPTLQGQQRE